MAKQQQVLMLEPNSELSFKGPFTEYVNANLTLSNPSSRDVYFKVKTTAPKFYCVRPNSGVIKAKDKTQINVMLQPVESPEALENERNRHKFMIQSAFAPEDQQPQLPVDQFWKSIEPHQIMDSKLRVVFQRPYGLGDETSKENFDMSGQGMPSKGGGAYSGGTASLPFNDFPVALKFNTTGKSRDSSSTMYSSVQAVQQEENAENALQKEIELRKMYQDEKANLEKENYALMEKIDKLAQMSVSGVGISGTQENVPILHAILFAVLALLIGLVVGKLL